MPSDLGAEEEELLPKASFSSSAERATALGCGVSLPPDGGGVWGEEVFEESRVYGGREISPGEGRKQGVFGGRRIAWLSRYSEGWFWLETLTNTCFWLA